MHRVPTGFELASVMQVDHSSDLQGRVFGQQLGFELSYFNHACMPNAYLSTELRAGCLPLTVARALLPIATAEPVCISYIPLIGACAEQRRCALRENYHFDCRCAACTDMVLDDAVAGWRCAECGADVARPPSGVGDGAAWKAACACGSTTDAQHWTRLRARLDRLIASAYAALEGERLGSCRRRLKRCAIAGLNLGGSSTA